MSADTCISKLECLYFKHVNKYYSTVLLWIHCNARANTLVVVVSISISRGLPSFILFSHKINYSYKCILMFHRMHEDVSLGVSQVQRGHSCKLTPLEMPTLRGTRISSDEQLDEFDHVVNAFYRLLPCPFPNSPTAHCFTG